MSIAALLLVFSFVPCVVAQNQQAHLALIGKSFGDSVVLRWGVSSYPAWKSANSAGFIIERFDLANLKKPGSGYERLTPTPLKPLSLEEWKTHFGKDDTLAATAAQALYGKSITTSKDEFGTIYELYTQQQTLHGFAHLVADISPKVADGLALRFADTKFSKGKSYIYRVFTLAKSQDMSFDTAYVRVNTSGLEKTGSIETLTAKEDELKITLSWDRNEHENMFSGYWIERSMNGGKSFERVNKTIFTGVRNTDDSANIRRDKFDYTLHLKANYQPVQYRVRGVTAFGELSPEGNTITAMGRDRTPPLQPLIERPQLVSSASGDAWKIQWNMPGTEGDLRGFYIMNSPSDEEGFEKVSSLLPPTAREYTDTKKYQTQFSANSAEASRAKGRYYAVVAIDTAGNERMSVSMYATPPDSIPPSTPQALKGSIDSNGIVRLSWQANSEKDLKGYRVFFTNQLGQEWIQLTQKITKETSYTDTLELNTLTEEIYYRINALDENYNHSEFSQVLKLNKPDIVPPVAPQISNVVVTDSSVHLRYSPSPSRDVVKHFLRRRETGTEAWIDIKNLSAEQTTVFDNTTLKNTLYEYAIIAQDDAGLLSPLSNVVTARMYDSGVRSGVSAVQAVYDSSLSRIVLKWVSPSVKEYEVYIYKSIALVTGASEPMLLRSVDSTIAEFVDETIEKGKTYSYSIKIVTPDGGESAMIRSEQVAVR